MPKINGIPQHIINEAKKYNDAPTPDEQYTKPLYLYDCLVIDKDSGLPTGTITSKNDYIRRVNQLSDGDNLILQVEQSIKIEGSSIQVSKEGSSEKIKLSGDINDLLYGDVLKQWKTNTDFEGLTQFFFLASETKLQDVELVEGTGISGLPSGLKIIPEEVDVFAMYDFENEYNKPTGSFRENNITSWTVKRYIPDRDINIFITPKKVIPKKIKKVRVYFENNFVLYRHSVVEQVLGQIEEYSWSINHLTDNGLEQTFNYNTPVKVLSKTTDSSFELELPDAGEYAYAYDIVKKGKIEENGSAARATQIWNSGTEEKGTLAGSTSDYLPYYDGSITKRPAHYIALGALYGFRIKNVFDIDFNYLKIATGVKANIAADIAAQEPELKDFFDTAIMKNKYAGNKSFINGGIGGSYPLPASQENPNIGENILDIPNKRYRNQRGLYNVDYQLSDNKTALGLSNLYSEAVISAPFRQLRYDAPTLITQLKSILDGKPIFNNISYLSPTNEDNEHIDQELPTDYETFTGQEYLALISIEGGLENISKEVDTSGSDRTLRAVAQTGKDGTLYNTLVDFKYPQPNQYYYNRIKSSWLKQKLGSIKINQQDRKIEFVSGKPVVFEFEYDNVIDIVSNISTWADTGGAITIEYLDENGNWPEVESDDGTKKEVLSPITYTPNLFTGRPKKYKYSVNYAA